MCCGVAQRRQRRRAAAPAAPSSGASGAEQRQPLAAARDVQYVHVCGRAFSVASRCVDCKERRVVVGRVRAGWLCGKSARNLDPGSQLSDTHEVFRGSSVSARTAPRGGSGTARPSPRTSLSSHQSNRGGDIHRDTDTDTKRGNDARSVARIRSPLWCARRTHFHLVAGFTVVGGAGMGDSGEGTPGTAA